METLSRVKATLVPGNKFGTPLTIRSAKSVSLARKRGDKHPCISRRDLFLSLVFVVPLNCDYMHKILGGEMAALPRFIGSVINSYQSQSVDRWKPN